MKTTKRLKKIHAAGFLLSLLILVAMSCKKNDDTPDPVPTPKPPAPINIFHTGFHKIMTDEEILTHKKFSGSYLYEIGTGLKGEDPGLPYGEIIKMLSEIHDNSQKKTEFDKIDNQLDSIASQMTDLNNEITALSQQVALSQADIQNQMNNLLTNTYITLINNAYDSSSSGGLCYYSSAARQIQSGQYHITMAQLDSTAMKDFVNNFGPSVNPNPMTNAMTQIQTALLGSAGPPKFNSSSIKQFADVIILNQNSQQYNATYAMNCYKILENYFLMAVNSQFRAFTIYGNALYRAETDTTQANHDYKIYLANFTTIIQSELQMFLLVTDYLSVNLLDYRNVYCFDADARSYFNTGLRSDEVCGSFIARANMLNQLLNFALGAPTKDFYLTIAVPRNYGNSAQLSWTSAPNTFPLSIDNSGNLLSRFPYTGWNGATCSSDNNITFYRDNDGTGGGSNAPLSSITITIDGAPWRHIASLQGNASIGYYNPNDISAAPQSTHSSTYCLAFGSASACWYWGYLYLNDNSNNNMVEAKNYNWPHGGSHTSPFIFNITSGGDHTPNYGGNFNWSDTYIGYAGTFPTTPHNEVLGVGQVRSSDISVSANTATLNSSIEVFTAYTVEPFGWSQSTETYFAGTDFSSGASNKNLLDYSSSSSSKSSETSYTMVTINSGSHSFNVGLWCENPNETGNSNSCNVIFYSQVIYGGTYNITK